MWLDGCFSPCPFSGVVRGCPSVVSTVPSNIEVSSALLSPWHVTATHNPPIYNASRCLKPSSFLPTCVLLLRIVSYAVFVLASFVRAALAPL